jgi:hypothetical protein
MADPDAQALASSLGLNLNDLMKNPGKGSSGLGMVYLGPKLGTKTSAPKGPYAPGYTPKYQGTTTYDYTAKDEMPYEEAQLMPLKWSDKEKRDFVNKGILYKMPGFSPDMGLPEIMSAWDDLSKMSATWAKQGQNWSPWDIMDSYKNDGKFGTVRRGDWLYDVATGEKVKYVGPKTKTTTDKRVDLSSPEDVKALTTQMLSELLGRAPTTEELARYRAAINGYEEANPEVTTTTTTLDDQGEAVAQSSKTTGGASEAARAGLVSEPATKGPEYGKYQSATTYFDAMMQMIGGG